MTNTCDTGVDVFVLEKCRPTPNISSAQLWSLTDVPIIMLWFVCFSLTVKNGEDSKSQSKETKQLENLNDKLEP